MEKGIAHYNSKTHQTPEVLVREDDHRFVLTTFDACDDNICMGTTDGKFYLHSISKGLYLYKRFEIARGGDGQIVNCLKFLDRE